MQYYNVIKQHMQTKHLKNKWCACHFGLGTANRFKCKFIAQFGVATSSCFFISSASVILLSFRYRVDDGTFYLFLFYFFSGNVLLYISYIQQCARQSMMVIYSAPWWHRHSTRIFMIRKMVCCLVCQSKHKTNKLNENRWSKIKNYER